MENPSRTLLAKIWDQHVGHRKALYEPVHGSPPDIAGDGIANPLGSILSVAMMLRMTLNRPDADLLEKAVDSALAARPERPILPNLMRQAFQLTKWAMRC